MVFVGLRNIILIYALLALAYLTLACAEPPELPPLTAEEREAIDNACGDGWVMVALVMDAEGYIRPRCGRVL